MRETILNQVFLLQSPQPAKLPEKLPHGSSRNDKLPRFDLWLLFQGAPPRCFALVR